jgi:hypothetical protein
MSANTASPSKKSTNVAEPCRHYEIGHDSGESALSEILTSATGCPLENMRELPVDAVGLGASAGCLPKRARAYQLSSRTLGHYLVGNRGELIACAEYGRSRRPSV